MYGIHLYTYISKCISARSVNSGAPFQCWSKGYNFAYFLPVNQGSFWSENYIYFPPPFLKMIFFPLSRHVVFLFLLCPFSLNLSYLHLFNPFTSHLSLSFPFPTFLSSFFLFLKIFPFFLFPFSYFSPNDISWYSALRGRGIFQYIDPCCS